MPAENFFDRISNGNSISARRASNIFFAFACLCSPGVFLVTTKFPIAVTIPDLGVWLISLVMCTGFLFLADDIQNFAFGKKVHLDNALYFDAKKKYTSVRWLSLVLDLF